MCTCVAFSPFAKLNRFFRKKKKKTYTASNTRSPHSLKINYRSYSTNSSASTPPARTLPTAPLVVVGDASSNNSNHHRRPHQHWTHIQRNSTSQSASQIAHKRAQPSALSPASHTAYAAYADTTTPHRTAPKLCTATNSTHMSTTNHGGRLYGPPTPLPQAILSDMDWTALHWDIWQAQDLNSIPPPSCPKQRIPRHNDAP